MIHFQDAVTDGFHVITLDYFYVVLPCANYNTYMIRPSGVICLFVACRVKYVVAGQGNIGIIFRPATKLVEKTDAAAASEYTQVLGVELELPVAGQQATAREPEPAGTTAEGETQPVTISNAQRLQTALTILQYLEDHDVLGDVVSVDVTDMGSVKMQYGQRFQIQLGDTTQMAYKIEMALAAVAQLADHDRGTLDVSFIVRQEVVYTPRSD